MPRLGAAVSKRRPGAAPATPSSNAATNASPGSFPRDLDDARALATSGRFSEAADLCDRMLASHPGNARVLYLRGLCRVRLGQLDGAVADLRQVVRLNPDRYAAWSELASALAALDLRAYHQEALSCHARAIALAPNSAETFYNRGVLLARLGRHAAALASYDRAIELRPAFAPAHNNRASVLAALDRHGDAIMACTRALEIDPTFVPALKNRATARSLVGEHEGAAEDAARAIELDGDVPFARGILVHSRMHCCDWRDYDANVAKIATDIGVGKRVIEPFALLGISSSPFEQLHCAQTWIRDHAPPVENARIVHSRHAHPRIRVAYMSANFRDHPLGYLMAALFERHDRSRFDVLAVSLGRSDGSAMRARLERAFDRFVDATALSDDQVAARIRDMEVDILVDRNGFTTGARLGILAQRPAPIQVNYLAYPGTMAAPYIDYVIADAVVVANDMHAAFTEKIVCLPDSYLVNDATRAAAADTPTRAQQGLPEKGFVFCCFNNPFKITPAVFDIWMRLLQRVEGSVLWLMEGSASVRRNLQREALARGVRGERLVFAQRLPNAQHLARHRLAHLFLDTLPCNAHTTASDALWMGLPVITRIGTTFAGRVAASLLNALAMPELVTHSAAQYEALSLRLASDADALARLTQRLAAQRAASTLFDTDATRRAIEGAYVEMWTRHRRGDPPASFAVDRHGAATLTLEPS
jgi:predicted O-linked N-acetylglucosamine transferase (SPINDLY family)